jgi:hypothetical protein
MDYVDGRLRGKSGYRAVPDRLDPGADGGECLHASRGRRPEMQRLADVLRSGLVPKTASATFVLVRVLHRVSASASLLMAYPAACCIRVGWVDGYLIVSRRKSEPLNSRIGIGENFPASHGNPHATPGSLVAEGSVANRYRPGQRK